MLKISIHIQSFIEMFFKLQGWATLKRISHLLASPRKSILDRPWNNSFTTILYFYESIKFTDIWLQIKLYSFENKMPLS
jgi:hypothetical protein